MNELLVPLLSLSISASLIALILFALRPLYRSRLSKAWQYYIWLVVAARLLLPFAPETNLMEYLFRQTEQPVAAAAQPENRQETRPDIPSYTVPDDEAVISDYRDTPKATESPKTPFQLKAYLEQNLFTIWLVVALVLFVRKLTSYLSFIRYIRAGRQEINRTETMDAYFMACKESGISNPLPIYENRLVSSPMLVGMIRPCIVLPELQLDTESLRLILRHELIHHKRRDILYKWLVQLVLCIHWFNPLMYLVSREINRNCELSCDEAVIGPMADADKRQYGDTLLATLKAGGNYGNAVASITLTEDGKNLKERLQAILRHHSGSMWTKIAAVVLSVVVLCGASFAGAYAGVKRSYMPEYDVQPTLKPVAEQMAEQKAAVPRILKQGEYSHIVTAAQGSAHSVPFQASGKQTALYVYQEGEGTFTLSVRGQSGNDVVLKGGVSFTDDKEPVLVFSTDSNKVYSLEISIPADGPAVVAVYGAGMDRANEYTGITLPDIPIPDIPILDIPAYAGSLGANIAKDVTDRILDATKNQWALNRIDDWAEKWGNQWGNIYNDGDSWRYLKYLYEDGYLVGVGIRINDSLDSYSTTETVTLGGQTYTLAYSPAAVSYAGNAKIRGIIEKILTEHLFKDSSDTRNRIYFTVRSVIYNTDPQDLLRSLYRDRTLVEFMEVVGHCKGLPVIEELLHKAADDQEGIYFMFLAEQLPDSFSVASAEALARQAAENQDILMLSALERLLPESLYESFMKEALGLDNFKFGPNKE